MSDKNLKFNDNVKKFDLDGIPIIGNFQNQAIIGLDDDGVNFISKLESGNINLNNLTEKEKELFEALKENEYFAPNKTSKLSCAYVHVTDNCNLHCVGCYSFKEHRNEKKDLNLDEIKSIFKKLVDAGVYNVVISGGEPFLRDDLSQILKYAKEDLKLKELSVITNGTMPLEKYEKCLPYINKLSISIDGYDKKTRFIRDPGIMPKVFETIENLKEKVSLALIATFHKKTSPYIEKFAQLSKDIDVPLSFSILTVDYSNPAFKDYILETQDYERMYDFLENNKDITMNDSIAGNVGIISRNCCGVGTSLVSIGADGAIYPCQMLHREELIIGNILTDDITEILQSDKNPCKNLSVDIFEECKDCKYKYVCGSGCRASSYYTYGDLLHPELCCKQTKKYLKYIVDNMKDYFHIK